MLELSLAAMVAASCFGQWAHLPSDLNNQGEIGFSISVSPKAFVSMQFTDMGRLQAQGLVDSNESVRFAEDGDGFVLRDCTATSARVDFADGRSFALVPLEGDFWEAARSRGWQAHGESDSQQSVARAAPQPLLLWSDLSSGMTVEQVSASLQARGLRSQAGQDANGLPTLNVRGHVDVAGRRAALRTSFQRSGLFWVELEYSLGSSDDPWDHFDQLTRALAGPYGSPVSADQYPSDLTSPNARRLNMLVERQDAVFEQSGLRVELTVSSLIEPSRVPEQKVRIRYWRSIDAVAYARALNAADDREQAQRDQALREGL